MKNLAYLILMLTDQCNLSCQYCYLGSNKKRMTQDTCTNMPFEVIDRALDLWALEPEQCRIQITGGEPFIAGRQLEYAVQKIRRISSSCPVAVQTNATLLDSYAIDFIKEHNLELGISLDGDPTIQDISRGGADKTFRGLKLIEEKKIPFNVTCVISSINADKLHRLALALAGFSMARGIGFDLLVNKGNACTSNVLPATPVQIENGVKKLKQALNLINAGRQIPIVVREQEKIKNCLNSNRSSAFCHAVNGQSLAVTPQGDLYPCSQTAFDPDFFIGSLNKGPFLEKKLPVLASSTLQKKAARDCSSCFLLSNCPGECPSRLYYNQSNVTLLVCTLYRALAPSAPAFPVSEQFIAQEICQ